MLRLLLCCLAAAALVLAGCGDESDAPSAGAAATTTPTRTTAAPKPIDSPFPEKPRGPGPHPGAKVEQLVIEDVVEGTGAEIQAGDTGQFDFIGVDWITGRPLDDSWGKKKPYETVIDRGVVIDGWWQGVPGMRVGGRRTILVPPELGFTQSLNARINGATTYFDVVLRGVKPAEPEGVGGGGEAAS